MVSSDFGVKINVLIIILHCRRNSSILLQMLIISTTDVFHVCFSPAYVRALVVHKYFFIFYFFCGRGTNRLSRWYVNMQKLAWYRYAWQMARENGRKKDITCTGFWCKKDAQTQVERWVLLIFPQCALRSHVNIYASWMPWPMGLN